MQYDAVTIDTNIFRHNGWRLEDGMIGQLVQFKDSSAQFILSEIVVKEVHKYLEIEANEAKVALVNAIKKCTRNGLLSPGTFAQLNDISNSTSSPEDVAKQRFQAFTDVTGMIIVPAELTEIKELIKRYFRPAAPFEASGKKKNEFPDAIALLSLEKWGESNGKRILAISDDGGWSDFAKDSEWIDVEKDFAAALQLLQQQSEQAKVLIASLLKYMDSGSRPELLHQVTNAIDSAVELMDVFAEASSAFHFEENLAILTYQDFHFLTRDGDYEFKIVQIGKDKIVAMIDLSITCPRRFSTSPECR